MKWWAVLGGAVVVALVGLLRWTAAAPSDEELWLQRALTLDLAHTDQRVRAVLVGAAQAHALQGRTFAPPTDAQLRAHYAAHRDRFTQPTGLQLRRIAFSENGESVKRAWQNSVDAYRRLTRGEDFARVRAALGDSDPIAIPASVIALGQLRQLLGVDMTVSVLRLRAGQISRPVEEHGFIFIYQMQQRDVPMPSTFEVARADVLADYQQRTRAAALAQYLAPLRRGAG